MSATPAEADIANSVGFCKTPYMKTLFNDDPKNPECLLSASTLTLNKLGRELQLISDKIFYKGDKSDAEGFYNSVLSGVSFVIEEDDSDKIALNLNDNILVISGNKIAMSDLGESLVNVFDDNAKEGSHLHYDYLNGHGLTRETNISLVISCWVSDYTQNL